MTDWIDVKKFLPTKEIEDHILIFDGVDVLFASYDSVNSLWWSDIGIVAGVTHWRPLPNPPEES